MQILAVWPTILLVAALALIVFRWRHDVRKFQTQMLDLEDCLCREKRKREEFEGAIDKYYIPQWQDAAERLAAAPVCTCPPYPYRNTCLKHSPKVLKRQIETLKQIEGKHLQADSSQSFQLQGWECSETSAAIVPPELPREA